MTHDDEPGRPPAGGSEGPALEPGGRLELDIASIDSHGDGVARVGGLVVFVEGALPGDRVEAVVTQRSARYARARRSRIVEPSPMRVAPRCGGGDCGGCPLVELAYGAQLAEKRRHVVEALRRIGGIAGAGDLVGPVRGMEEPWGYRNKAQHPVGPGPDGRPVVGYYRRGTHEVVASIRCPVQHPTNQAVAAAFEEEIRALGLGAYDEATGQGILRHLVTRASEWSGDALALVVTAVDSAELRLALARLYDRMLEKVPRLAGLVQNVNPARTNVILGPVTRLIAGRDSIEERLDGLRLRLTATAFFQVNSRQAAVLYQEVRQRVARFVAAGGCLSEREGVLLDLYCGVGGIGLFCASHVHRVVGVEQVEQAVRDARFNANLNGVANATFHAADVRRWLGSPAEHLGSGRGPLMVVVDPPRRGLEPEVVEAIARARPGLLVYVSCNPATMARDLAQFLRKAAQGGASYSWEEVTPVDMFPHTAHVEAVASLVCSARATSRRSPSPGRRP